MDREQWYELLGKRMARIEHELTPEGRTELDGILWLLAQEIAEKLSCTQNT